MTRKESVNEILKTHPNLIPDFVINNKNGNLVLSFNKSTEPKLSQLLDNHLNSKLSPWFKQRKTTQFLIVNTIMKYQKNYFMSGDITQLKPMVLRDISKITGLNQSTVWCVINSKYVQTPCGAFLLNNILSESIQNEQGEEISTRVIKKILSDYFENENNPLSDEKITIFMKQKGYSISRRTVVKYRKELNIPNLHLRKKEFFHFK